MVTIYFDADAPPMSSNVKMAAVSRLTGNAIDIWTVSMDPMNDNVVSREDIFVKLIIFVVYLSSNVKKNVRFLKK